jgi:ABC-type multidrug transport system permease subunit
MAIILGMPLMNQLQPRFAELAQVYLVREMPSKMYHWSTFVLSALLVEIPYNLMTGTLFFFPWYFAVGFYRDWPDDTNKNARGVYIWLMLMFFEMWISTFGQAIAALAPNPQTASTLTTLFASFVVAFNGVLQPLSHLVKFWHWMYYLSPYTWLIGGMMSTAVHGVPINCATKEINHFSPPFGQTCGEYAGAFARMRGRLLNPDATADCMYCRYANSDEYLRTLNMNYNDHWRNMGLMAVYVIFNMTMAFVFFYLAKVVSWNSSKLTLLKSRKRTAR